LSSALQVGHSVPVFSVALVVSLHQIPGMVNQFLVTCVPPLSLTLIARTWF
jgi:hypothetical protein